MSDFLSIQSVVAYGHAFTPIETRRLLQICGSIFSYVIIVVQFSPPLAFVDQTKLVFVDTKELLGHIENTVEFFRLLPVGFDQLVPLVYDLEGNSSYAPFGVDILV